MNIAEKTRGVAFRAGGGGTGLLRVPPALGSSRRRRDADDHDYLSRRATGDVPTLEIRDDVKIPAEGENGFLASERLLKSVPYIGSPGLHSRTKVCITNSGVVTNTSSRMDDALRMISNCQNPNISFL